MKNFLSILALLASFTTPLSAYAQTEPPVCEPGDVTCVNTPADSQWNGGSPVRINSKDAVPAPIYHRLVSRYRFELAGPGSQYLLITPVTVDYMVHEPAVAPTGLVVLIAGGQLNANIEGTEGGPVTNAGGNFLVRSAHLFRDQGYRVVTIDRPSDWEDFLSGAGNEGWRLDGYRTSNAHLYDLDAVIDAQKVPDRNVYLAGTSRGTISAVRWNSIADGISLSAPVTGGPGTPLGSPGLTAADINVPTCVHWHACDACSVSTPLGAQQLLNDLIGNGVTAGGASLSGGFSHPDDDACDARTLHGFFGIESCAVDQIAQCLRTLQVRPWLRLRTLYYPKPVYGPDPVRFSLRAAVEPQRAAGKLVFRLLGDGNVDSRGGSLHLKENGLATFTPPSVLQPGVAKFAFEVTDERGHKATGVTAFNVIPAPGVRTTNRNR